MSKPNQSLTNQSKIFHAVYSDRSLSSFISKLTSGSLVRSVDECDTLQINQDTKLSEDCRCSVCGEMRLETLDESYLILKQYVDEKERLPTLSMLVMFLKKFKNIRLGTIFQAQTIYNIACEKYNISTYQSLEQLRLASDDRSKNIYNAALNLHATMINIYSNYIIAKPTYKFGLIKEVFAPIYKIRDKSIEFIHLMLIEFDEANKTKAESVILTKLINKFMHNHSVKSKKKKWEINDFKVKLDRLSPSSISDLNQHLSSLLEVHKTDEIVEEYNESIIFLRESLLFYTHEEKFLHALKKGLENKLGLVLIIERLVNGLSTVLVSNDYDNTESNEITNCIDEIFSDNIEKICVEFCPGDDFNHTFILNSYIRSLVTSCRFGPKIILNDYQRRFRFNSLIELEQLNDCIAKWLELNSDTYLEAYYIDSKFLQKIYLYKKMGSTDYQLNSCWGLNYIRNIINEYYESIRKEKDNFVLISLALENLLNIYKYVYFYYKDQLTRDKKPTPMPNSMDVDLIAKKIVFYTEKIYSLNANCHKDNSCSRKILQIKHFKSKSEFYSFWSDTMMTNLQLQERDYDVFLGLSARDLPDDPEQQHYTYGAFLNAINEGFYLKQQKQLLVDIEPEQRRTNYRICVAEKIVVIDTHNRLPTQAGGSYYSTKARCMSKAMIRIIIQIIKWPESEYAERIRVLTEPLRACFNLIRDEAYEIKDSGKKEISPNFSIKVITGGMWGGNYNAIKSEVEKFEGSLKTHNIERSSGGMLIRL
jgi:hypothetical protein